MVAVVDGSFCRWYVVLGSSLEVVVHVGGIWMLDGSDGANFVGM